MKRPPESRARPRTRHGFTLLEVLAAVAILGLWYVVIAHSSVLALSTEGENLRRLEAGTIADIRLAEIEAALRSGVMPEDGEQESEDGDYRVRVEVGPFAMGAAPASPEQSAGGAERPDLRSFLASEMLGVVIHLHSLRVAVAWGEADGLRVVSRTSFAFDSEAFLEQLEELARRGSSQPGQGPVDRTQ